MPAPRVERIVEIVGSTREKRIETFFIVYAMTVISSRVPSGVGEPYSTTISKVYCEGTSRERGNGLWVSSSRHNYGLELLLSFERDTLRGQGCPSGKQRVSLTVFQDEKTRVPKIKEATHGHHRANVNLGQIESSRGRRLTSIWFPADFCSPCWPYSLSPVA